MHAWMNDREVTRFLEAGRYPLSLASERAWAERAAQANDFANVTLAIETLDGIHIGNCGIHNTSPEHRKGTLGIAIGEKTYWGRGYGADAVRCLLRLAFERMNLRRVELTVLDFNERARACYRKCGFVEEGRLRQERFVEGGYTDTIVMGLLREEWEAMSAASG
jgi:RimJ/RimL family protein N-acetyltransferase